MDLKAKWNKLVNMSKTQKGFKGQGHKLGTADTDAQVRQAFEGNCWSCSDARGPKCSQSKCIVQHLYSSSALPAACA